MNLLGQSHFELFGLPERFLLDEAQLQDAYRRVQSAVHPDRFAAGSDAQRRLALQLATRVNEAFRILSDVARRAQYLCERHGVSIDADTHTAMPEAFLLRQMQWRESLMDARQAHDAQALSELSADVDRLRAELLSELSHALDRDGDYVCAADVVRRWMFVDRFGQELNAAEAALAA